MNYKITPNYKTIEGEVFKLRTISRVIDCLNTIYDMQNEKDCLNHHNEFLYILDFEKLFSKIVGAFFV